MAFLSKNPQLSWKKPSHDSYSEASEAKGGVSQWGRDDKRSEIFSHEVDCWQVQMTCDVVK
jgi:hypothetical protein